MDDLMPLEPDPPEENGADLGHFAGDEPAGGSPRASAALLLGVGELSYSEVAARVGVDRKTLFRWRQDPDFMARVKAVRDGVIAEGRDYGIALRHQRVRALNERWARLRAIIDARAADPSMQAAPGGSTGLLVRTVKRVKDGAKSRVLAEYAVDTGLLAELRAIEQQAARELGQWADKHEVTGAGGGPMALSLDFERKLRLVYGDGPPMLDAPEPRGPAAGGAFGPGGDDLPGER